MYNQHNIGAKSESELKLMTETEGKGTAQVKISFEIYLRSDVNIFSS